jgi:hypothetical protein
MLEELLGGLTSADFFSVPLLLSRSVPNVGPPTFKASL